MKVFLCLVVASLASAAPQKDHQIVYGTGAPQKDHQIVYGEGLIMPEYPEIDLASERYINSLTMNREWAPSSYDSVLMGYVTPPKNQKQCGSCAAFSSASVMETCMMKVGGNEADLSEQTLINCGFNGKSRNACNGAYPEAYLLWVKESHEGQLPHETVSPYTNSLGRCAYRENYHTGAKVTNVVHSNSCDEERLKYLVYNHGAVISGVYASPLKTYKNGIFTGCSDKKLNKHPITHAITVVGYGTENGIDYWKVKNSWSEKWGEDGFFRIQRGVGECSIGSVCATASCEETSEKDDIITTTPLPASAKCDISKLYGRTDMNGIINLNTETDHGRFRAKVNCVNSICTPVDTSIKEACQYICGRDIC